MAARGKANRRGGRDPFPVSSCDCADCRKACTVSPGWFMPEEVPRLAAHLDVPLAEVFRKRLAVGVTGFPGGVLRHGVMPHKLRDGKKPGMVWTLDELARPGRCVFFDRGRCTIYPVRPYECARMIHESTQDSVALRHRIVVRWTEEALAPYRRLVGRPLVGAPPRRGKPGRRG